MAGMGCHPSYLNAGPAGALPGYFLPPKLGLAACHPPSHECFPRLICALSPLCSGANLDVDVPWKWLNFFMEDDAKLEQVKNKIWQVVLCPHADAAGCRADTI